jgi:hypothetical protein
MILPSSGPFTVIQTDGSTGLAEIGNNYFLYSVGGSLLAELSYGTTAVTAGEFPGFNPVGAVTTATGYDIAWKNAPSGQFMVWSTNASGKYAATILSAITGLSYGLESLEPIFGQDLNGDNIIGLNPTVIQIDNSTSLDQIGNNYFLFAAGTTTGVELKQGTLPVVVGQLSGFTPIAGVKTATGYDVAWKNATTGTFTIWSVNSKGTYTTTLLNAGAATGTTLESLELVFDQDLNGDGAIDTPTTVINVSGYVLLNLNLNQAIKIAAGATAELGGSDSASVTFSGSTGTLIIDSAATFTGPVIGFKGTGKVASSDIIDLRNVAFATATKSFTGTAANGTLTVSDSSLDTAHISLTGNYLTSTFFLSSDGHGGTDVIDPPLTPDHSTGIASFDTSAAARISAVSVPPSADFGVARRTTDSGTTAQAVTPANNRLDAGSDVAINGPSSGAQMLNGSSLIAGTAAPAISPAPKSEVAREVVSAHDVIRAIKTGDIAIKRADAELDRIAFANRVWLFDDAEGAFVAPAPEALTIVIDRGDTPALPMRAAATVGLIATAALISTEPPWLGVLREFGRKAARVVQQRARWM